VLDPRAQSQPGGAAGGGWLGFNRYQWVVIAAAWLGWGFDVFDALLFNFVAPSCIPTLLDLPLGSAAARSATVFWTGVITSILLVGWALGGVVFGLLADRIGRHRTVCVRHRHHATDRLSRARQPRHRR
jgi:MFS family permease